MPTEELLGNDDARTGDIIPGGVLTRRAPETAFAVHLENFEGPFDLLLGLIAKHKLDITEIALAQVTDEFLTHLRVLREQGGWDLSQASEFLLVAATLLDLKSARLLPQLETQDEEDLALIEARDLLFARLLQYRAFKRIAAEFEERMVLNRAMVARRAGVDPRFERLLPELIIGITPEQLAMIAARAMTPKVVPTVGVDHLHAPAVSVQEQAAIIGERLRRHQVATFRALVADAESALVIVARFLALLELYREQEVSFEQAEALGELTIRWVGSGDGAISVSDEFDDPDDEPAAVAARHQVEAP